GMIVAGELWVPGQKLISIPSGKQFYGPSLFEMMGQNIRYVGPENKTVTVTEFYNWLRTQFPKTMIGAPYDTVKPHMVSLRSGYRIENPEHLVEGTLQQDRLTASATHGDREYWSSEFDLNNDELVTDKLYRPAADYYSTDVLVP
ncbi:MAG: hypothetical protein ACYSW3_09010, partial [Planctomycetota bacterium]